MRRTGIQLETTHNPTTKDILGRRHNIAYIKRPMTLEYGTHAICCCSIGVYRQSWRL